MLTRTDVAVPLIAVAVFVALVGSCSQPVEQKAQEQVALVVDMPLFAHPGGCRQCHTTLVGNNLPTAPAERGVCATSGCHTPFVEKHEFVHGPVALGDCTTCHVPHSSDQSHLLAMAEARLCGGCHTALLTCPSTSAAEGRSCATCHNAHGGESHYLLRSDAVATGDAPPEGTDGQR